MTCLCYLIVCFYLLYSFDQTPIVSNSKTWNVRSDEEEFLITAENQYALLANSVSPYWNLSYDEQLRKKQNSCIAMIDMIVKSSDSLKNLMTYKLYQIVPSPVTRAYRNKDQFQIKRGLDGNIKTVGCSVKNHSLGKTYSVHPTYIDTIKESHKKVAKVFEDFIRISRVKATYEQHEGHWNTLIVRSNMAGDVIACVTVQVKGSTKLIKSIIHRQQNALKKYFLKHLPDITLFYQKCPKKQCTRHEAPFNPLYGKRFLMETLKGYKFKILPDTIFPINTKGTEVMYDNIIRTAKLDPNTTVLDIWSGQGLNSIMMSNFVNCAVAIDSAPEKVTQARNFAKFNNIQNVKFLLKELNGTLNSVLENIKGDVVAILNYKRSGLGLDVLRTVRSSLQISRLLYLFYKPNSPKALEDIVYLCSNKNESELPFRLTKVIPIDLLPQTAHVDLILLFQREHVGNIEN